MLNRKPTINLNSQDWHTFLEAANQIRDGRQKYDHYRKLGLLRNVSPQTTGEMNVLNGARKLQELVAPLADLPASYGRAGLHDAMVILLTVAKRAMA